MNNCSCSSSESTTNIPGSAGVQGVSAFTTTNGSFTIPAADGVTTVDIPVNSYSWMVKGMYLAIPGLIAGQIGIFQVSDFIQPATVRVTYPALTSNTHAGDIIPSGSGVACSGPGLTSPLAIVSGGTGGGSKAVAQTALGLGQDSVIGAATGLTQDLTNGYVQVGAFTVTIPAAGSYLFLAQAVLAFAGTTLASTPTLSVKLNNSTQGLDLASATDYFIGNMTTTTYPALIYSIVPILYSAGAANDVVKMFIKITTAASAGTLRVSAGSITAIPLRKS